MEEENDREDLSLSDTGETILNCIIIPFTFYELLSLIFLITFISWDYML